MPDPEAPIYRLKIRLLGIEPPIWRRIEVPGSVDLERLHEILQVAMGWGGEHLYAFDIEGVEYSDAETVEEVLDEGYEAVCADEVRLDSVVTKVGQRFGYDYDFSDDWEHRIEVEAIDPPDPELRYPRCPAGGRACPPEDSGGPEGYQALLEALSDPEQPDHVEARLWVGRDWNPEHFDRSGVNQRLAERFQAGA